jgi:hypothetical protein
MMIVLHGICLSFTTLSTIETSTDLGPYLDWYPSSLVPVRSLETSNLTIA